MANNNFISFDVENVKTKMDSLETDFTNFADVLKELNDYIETMINAGADSAIYGEYGTKLLNIWNANASNFGDFHANFAAWNEAVAIIAANNEQFTVETTALYRDNASSLDGVKDARKWVKKHGRTGDYTGSSASTAKVLGNASQTNGVEVEELSDGSKKLTYKDKNGEILQVQQNKYDDKGNIVSSKTFAKDGKTLLMDINKDSDGVTTKIDYSNGNMKSKQLFDKNNNPISQVTYDEDGKPIETMTAEYNDEGKIVRQTINNDSEGVVEISFDKNGKQQTAIVTSKDKLMTQEIEFDEYGQGKTMVVKKTNSDGTIATNNYVYDKSENKWVAEGSAGVGTNGSEAGNVGTVGNVGTETGEGNIGSESGTVGTGEIVDAGTTGSEASNVDTVENVGTGIGEENIGSEVGNVDTTGSVNTHEDGIGSGNGSRLSEIRRPQSFANLYNNENVIDDNTPIEV